MFWNRNNRGTVNIFNTGTADDRLGLFYDNKNCDICSEDCCILLEGINQGVILLDGLEDCVQMEGCDGELSILYLRAITN